MSGYHLHLVVKTQPTTSVEGDVVTRASVRYEKAAAASEPVWHEEEKRYIALAIVFWSTDVALSSNGIQLNLYT